MKINNVRKFIRAIFIIFVIIFLFSLLISNKIFSHKEIEYKKTYVSKGDTLWSIAELNQRSNNYYKGRDIRYIIYDLMKINNLENCNIKVNQEILIPIE